MMLEGEEAPEESPEEVPYEEAPQEEAPSDESPEEEAPAPPPPPPAPKPEDYIMFREGAMLYYVSVCYLAFEAFLFILLLSAVYLKLRLEAD
jgi:hypothetical protein